MSTSHDTGFTGILDTSPQSRLAYPDEPLALRFNHPKNYIGVPLAIAASELAGPLIQRTLVSMAGAARDGARLLGFVDTDGRRTPLGHHVCEVAIREHGSVERGLDSLADLRGNSTRLTAARPQLAKAGRRAVAGHPTVRLVHDVLDGADGPLTLPQLVASAFQRDPDTVRASFIQNEAAVHSAIRDWLSDTSRDIPGVDTVPSILHSTEAYRSYLHSQLKSVLCHLGIVALPGADTTTLDPLDQTWRLDTSSGGDRP